MSIIRRGDFHKDVPSCAPRAGDGCDDFTFIELFIVIGIVATLATAIYVAVATERQVQQIRRVTRFAQ